MTRPNARYTEPAEQETDDQGRIRMPGFELAKGIGIVLGLPVIGIYVVVKKGYQLTKKQLKQVADYGGEYEKYDS